MPHDVSHRAPKGRTQAVAALALLLASPLAAAAAGTRAPPPTPDTADRRALSQKESQDIGDAVRRRDEARQREWDRKMKAITGGICVGC